MSKIINPSWTILVSLVQFQILSPKKKQKTYPTRFPTFTFTKPALGFLLEKPRRRAKVTHPRGGNRGANCGESSPSPPSEKGYPPWNYTWKWMEDDFFPFSGAWPIFSESFWGAVYHDSGSYLQGAPNIAPGGGFLFFFTKNERVGRHKVHPSGSSGECFFLRLHSLVFEKSFMSFWCYFCFMKCYWRDRMLYLWSRFWHRTEICYIQAAFVDVRCVASVSPIHLVLIWGEFPQQTNAVLRDF